MSEETSESVEPTETVGEAQAPSLDDIAQEFSVEEQANNFQAQPEASPNPPQQGNWAPDPITDPESFNQYSRQQAEGISSLNNTVQELNQRIQSYEDQLAQQKVNADVDMAVAKVNEKLGVDPDMAEAALWMEYNKNPSFQKIWNNRSQNPAAFDKALAAVADKYSSKFAISQDPQLTENQLAAKQSLKTTQKTPHHDPNDEWAKLSPAEFDQKWNQMRRG